MNPIFFIHIQYPVEALFSYHYIYFAYFDDWDFIEYLKNWTKLNIFNEQ